MPQTCSKAISSSPVAFFLFLSQDVVPNKTSRMKLRIEMIFFMISFFVELNIELKIEFADES